MYGEVVDGVEPHLFEDALAAAEGRARRVARPRSRRPTTSTGSSGTFKAIYEREVGEPLPAGRARPAAPRLPRGVRLVGHAARAGLPPHLRHPRRHRHGRATSCRWSSATRASAPARASASRATRRPASASSTASSSSTRRARTSSPGSARRSRSRRWSELLPEAYAQLAETLERLEAPLPRHAGHRVHGRGGDALPAADPHRQAHGEGRAADRGRDGRGGADLPRGGRRADRPGAARPAAAPDDRPDRRGRGRRARG